jgi:hypothetical protein
METITFGIVETYSTFVSREPVTINISDYPELEGKTEEEIKEYIINNYDNMKPSTKSDYLASLYDELMEQEIIKEKITDETIEIWFE